MAETLTDILSTSQWYWDDLRLGTLVLLLWLGLLQTFSQAISGCPGHVMAVLDLPEILCSTHAADTTVGTFFMSMLFHFNSLRQRAFKRPKAISTTIRPRLIL